MNRVVRAQASRTGASLFTTVDMHSTVLEVAKPLEQGSSSTKGSSIDDRKAGFPIVYHSVQDQLL